MPYGDLGYNAHRLVGCGKERIPTGCEPHPVAVAPTGSSQGGLQR